MKKKFLKKAGAGIVLGLAFLPLVALAQTGVPGPIVTSPVQIAALLQKVLYFVGAIVMTIALIMLLWSAILYLTAGGSEDRVGRAKNYLIYAIVGIVVAVLAFSVIPFVQTVLQGGF